MILIILNSVFSDGIVVYVYTTSRAYFGHGPSLMKSMERSPLIMEDFGSYFILRFRVWV